MALPPPYVPNNVMTVAANLRYLDNNGILVEQLFPWDYINVIGNRLSSLITQYNEVNTVLTAYNTRIVDLEEQVAQILVSGFTMPLVNGGCLNSNTEDYVQDITALLVSNTCDYNEVLGTTTDINVAIAAQCNNLNTADAYSQNTAMAALPGWSSTVGNLAESITNLWLSYCDMRAGVDNAIEWSKPTCGSIVISLSGYYNPSTKVLTVYTGGSHLPANFSDDGGSELVVKDSYGNSASISMNIETVVSAGYVEIDLTSSSLSETSVYSAFFTWDVTSTTPALGCTGTKVVTVENTTIVCTPVSITPTANAAQFSFTPYVTSNVVYTVELLSTSGTTVEATQVFVNPTSAIVGTFTNLVSATDYWLQLTVTVGGVATTCPIYTFQTTS